MLILPWAILFAFNETQHVTKQNKIAQGDINIFSHFNIRNYLPFSRFFRLNRKWLLQSKKYCQIRVQHVRISRKRHLTCLYRTILIMAAIFGRKTRKIVRAVLRKTESYRPILLIFNSKHGVAHGYIWSKFEQNRTKITAVRVPHTKIQNGRRWRHQIEISKIWEKWHRPMSWRLFVWNFIKIGPAV